MHVKCTSHASNFLEKEFLLTDAISVVRDRDINDLLPIAIYFGIMHLVITILSTRNLNLELRHVCSSDLVIFVLTLQYQLCEHKD